MTLIRKRQIKAAILDALPLYPESRSPMWIWEQIQTPLALDLEEWPGYRNQFDRLCREHRANRRKDDTYYKTVCVGKAEYDPFV